jgi:hypothetical protein
MDVSHFTSAEGLPGTIWLGGQGGNWSEILTCWRRVESRSRPETELYRVIQRSLYRWGCQNAGRWPHAAHANYIKDYILVVYMHMMLTVNDVLKEFITKENS